MYTLKEYYMIPAELFGIDLPFKVVGFFKTSGPQQIKANNVVVISWRFARVIIPNGCGVRLYTAEELNKLAFAGWVWKLKTHTIIPPRVRLAKNRLGLACLVPVQLMPVDSYKAVLIYMGLKAQRVWKKMT